MSYTVIAQAWEESERGWGVRPDGVSLHLTLNDCQKFRDEYWERERARTGGVVPDEYSRESGPPFSKLVSEKIYKALEERKLDFGVWEHNVR